MAKSPKSDSDYIELAYKDVVQNSYKILFERLGLDPAGEREHLTAFKSGLQVAKRAKQLALDAVGSPGTMTVSEGGKRN
jgi:hypothetical protein